MKRVFLVLDLPGDYVMVAHCWSHEVTSGQHKLTDKFNYPINILLQIETDYPTELAAKLRNVFKKHYVCSNTYALRDPTPLLEMVEKEEWRRRPDIYCPPPSKDEEHPHPLEEIVLL
ncbi:hypothetical protein VPHD260_0186 [Vibrio phage D260]